MELFEKQPPWYVAGLAFECQGCGHCCAGPEPGYVWVTEAEIEVIAAHLGMDEPAFRHQYVREAHGRLSLKEQPRINDCIFLQPNDSGGKDCMIYDIRPMQCRTWPFWASNLENPEAWAWAQSRCKGINRGPRHSLEAVEAKSNVTRE